jgi:hypothetical protein
MGINRALAPLALTIGFGVGTALAVNEVGELNQEADRIQACLNSKDTQIPFCYEYPMQSNEIITLRKYCRYFWLLRMVCCWRGSGLLYNNIENC